MEKEDINDWIFWFDVDLSILDAISYIYCKTSVNGIFR